jgi:hypothetical protein
MLHLVLEVGELLDDLLALCLRLWVLGLGDGTVDVVDGASLVEVRILNDLNARNA